MEMDKLGVVTSFLHNIVVYNIEFVEEVISCMRFDIKIECIVASCFEWFTSYIFVIMCLTDPCCFDIEVFVGNNLIT